MRRRDLLKLGGAGCATALAGVPVAAQNPAAQNTTPLKITKVEAFIARHPKDGTPEEDHVVMPPVGATTPGRGLWSRLDHASPSRFKQYQQFLLVKITTDQGIIGWGEGHAPAAPRVHKTVVSDLFAPVLKLKQKLPRDFTARFPVKTSFRPTGS